MMWFYPARLCQSGDGITRSSDHHLVCPHITGCWMMGTIIYPAVISNKEEELRKPGKPGFCFIKNIFTKCNIYIKIENIVYNKAIKQESENHGENLKLKMARVEHMT